MRYPKWIGWKPFLFIVAMSVVNGFFWAFILTPVYARDSMLGVVANVAGVAAGAYVIGRKAADLDL